MFKILSKVFILTIISFIFCNQIYATSEYLNEDFSNTLDSSIWTVYLNGGKLTYSNDRLDISTNNIHRFPFIHTKDDQLPQGNFSIEWKFQYNQQKHGTGIVISDILPPKDLTTGLKKEHIILNTWVTDQSEVALSSSICPSYDINCNWVSYPYYKSDSRLLEENIFKVEFMNGEYQTYFNGNPILKTTKSTRIPKYIWIGSPIYSSSGVGSWSSFSIDYIKITKLPDVMLDVPHFSQVDPDWKDINYDHSKKTIGQWGCAMTSSSMILASHGYINGPTLDIANNPLNLNSYLKDNHGFDNNAGIYWNEIIKFAKVSKTQNTQNAENKNLEFRYTPYNEDILKSDLDKGRPSIIQIVTGYGDTLDSALDDDLHFVVAKGYDDEHIYINDPLETEASDTLALDEAYPELEYRRLARFIPADSDLSYIWMHLFTDQQVLFEYDGKKSGTDYYGNKFSEIEDLEYYDEGGFDEMEGARTLILPQPEVGSYTLSVSGKGKKPIRFELISYDKNAERRVHAVNEKQENDGVNTYILEFSPEPEKYVSNFSKDVASNDLEVSFLDVRNLLIENRDKFKNKGTYNLMLTKINLAMFFYDKNMSKITHIMIDFMLDTLDKPNKQIDEEFRLQLLSKLETLKTGI